MKINKRGVALIFSFVVIAVLAILSAAMFSRSLSERRLTERSVEAAQAFWLAEAGVNRALKELRTKYSLTELPDTPLGNGGYSADIAVSANDTRTVTSRGFIPFNAPFRAERKLEVVMDKVVEIPDNFYDNAIYASDNVVLKGSAYNISGNVRFAGTISGDTSKITGGTIIPNPMQDTSIAPLALLDFERLRAISQSQGNYHDKTQLTGPFPASFWYDESNQIPNIVFMEGSLILKGNIAVGGFYVVGGEVAYNAAVLDNVEVEGCIYTQGNFAIGGGGNELNISGSVWVGKTAIVGGSSKIFYNSAYTSAIKDMAINTRVKIDSWKDTQNPYELVEP